MKMKRQKARVEQSTTCVSDLTLKDEYGSGAGLKDGIRAAGFKVGDHVVIVLKKDLKELEEKLHAAEMNLSYEEDLMSRARKLLSVAQFSDPEHLAMLAEIEGGPR